MESMEEYSNVKVEKSYQPCTSVASSEKMLANSFITILQTLQVTEFLVLVIFVKAEKPLKSSISATLPVKTSKYVLVLSQRPSLAQICDGSSLFSSHEMISGPYVSMRDSQSVLKGNGRNEQRDSTASMISSWKWKWFETWFKQDIVHRKFFTYLILSFWVAATKLWFGVVIGLMIMIINTFDSGLYWILHIPECKKNILTQKHKKTLICSVWMNT